MRSSTTESSPWDAIIIGGGPAGLSAALMLGRSRRRVLVIDEGLPRNRFAAHMHGVLGLEGLSPRELAQKGRAEAAAYGVEFHEGRVEHVADDGDLMRVRMPGASASADTLEARAIVVATGISDELPAIPGLVERWGESVLHCPYCHGWEVRDRALGVLLTSPAGVHQAELARQLSASVTVFTGLTGELDAEATARLTARGIRLVSAAVTELTGEGTELTGVRTVDGEHVAIEALFTAGTPRPHDGFVADLDLARADSPMGNVLAVDAVGRTSHPRIWATGNVVIPFGNVPASMGAGSMTGAAVNAALTAEDFDRAERDAPPVEAAAFWEERYRSRDAVWSGNPNQAVVAVARSLTPGAALDLGCGEGADVVWLADNGWTATGIDISPAAVERARRAGIDAGIPADRARFVVADLASWQTEERFDLVTASFLQSPVPLPREGILRRAADRVAPGGHLLVVAHAAAPPWAGSAHSHAGDDHRAHFPRPDEELAALALDEDEWDVVTAEVRERRATGPSGESATLEDSILLLRRR
ncbi:NAD(P)/FAD-dependent oxidoreductase [Microbacterium sp. LRZ72]|uniref:FAD-dependent oxidoreductase n=1 Tax=Microbacterium sp. LRZ72 TaxID=2942481 RepID=UPI0029AF338C|nr:FAD-dependent oxidoreductase [Microbacterium sp. LRZ72]MDX2376165.1 NAD(P)/FAD-dependent oxidoreductase [Microbacterium sp. LRZ72]